MASEETFKKGMSLLAGGVTVISTGIGTERRGITATAVCSLSASPPSLVACANKETGTAKSIKQTGLFAINVLGQTHQDLSMAFAGATGLTGEERFNHEDWKDKWIAHEMGVPYLDDAIAVFVCQTVQQVSHGSHYAFIANVVDVALINESEMPIAWMGSSFHSLSSLK